MHQNKDRLGPFNLDSQVSGLVIAVIAGLSALGCGLCIGTTILRAVGRSEIDESLLRQPPRSSSFNWTPQINSEYGLEVLNNS